MRLNANQRKALAWLEEHGPLYSWAVRRSGYRLGTWEALAEKGAVTRVETTSRYTGLAITEYHHPNGHGGCEKTLPDPLHSSGDSAIIHPSQQTTPSPEETIMLDHADILRLQTAPSGKVLKWGVVGHEDTFKSKNEALAFIKDRDEKAAAAKVEVKETPAPKAKAPKAGTKASPAPAMDPLEGLLPEGATLVASPTGRFSRVMVGGKSLGYVFPRQRGTVSVEILTSRLGAAKDNDLEGTKPRQSQTALLVNDPTSRKRARRLFEIAAATVEVAK